MEAKAYFDSEIKAILCEEISKSSKSIFAAVAWFNDSDIFEILKEKANSGVDINIIVANDEKNNSLNFKEISDLGGKVFKLIKDDVLLHHKFCVIDEHTLITGSYNWTYAASSRNLENIIVLENNVKINSTFIQCFNRILEEEFHYIEETVAILGDMQQEIENLKNSIIKYKEVPISVMMGIERIKSQSLVLDRPLNSLLSLDSNQINSSKSYPLKSTEELIDWWKSLDSNWKVFFNSKVFERGAIMDMPDIDGLERLLSLDYINCQKFKAYNKTTKEPYELTTLNGIRELKNIRILDCSYNSLTKLDPISGHKQLEKLTCSNNKISSLESISLLQNLNYLDCINNNLTSLKGIETFVSLEYLRIDLKFRDSQKDIDRIIAIGLKEVGLDNNSIEFRK
ncbi:phospholipase D-like domain-containing protein [Cytophagales bacterium LB-30]|uniref:phospholipase D n=1 Tax=Shiella aurantiaca TaxID=3058365 RepID=A0ABT8F8Y5_9BACT|nr:phospholipase D-like domain-containing protein [Shiella aurantiaca]MDN4166850.1 phospholipase D-like domain-containing protein [Shiella aurantiaca]